MKALSGMILISLAAMVSSAADAVQPPQLPARPNIIVILADDLGKRDLTIYGSSFYETPNLDRLAASGVMFTQAYTASNVCSPTRASLLTGRHPARLGLTDWLPGRPDRPDQRLARPALPAQLAPEAVTFAEAFKEAGYRTASIGKWHLGETPESLPTAQGFDVNIAGSGRGSPPSYFSPYRLPNLTDGPPGEHLDDRLTDEAITFIKAAAGDRQPFLVYLSHYAVHTPLQGKPELVAKYQGKLATITHVGPEITNGGPDGRQRVVQSHPVYAAMVENLDANVGRLTQALESLGLAENTIVVFTSDNGGLSTAEGMPTSNRPLRAGKGWAYEGGVRAPLLVAWPGRVPAGSTTDTIMSSPDLFPTLLELAGLPARPEAHLDGRSLAPALFSPQAALPDRPIFWHYPHYSNQRGKPHGAVHEGRWKLIEWFEDMRVELFDLESDLAEAYDISGAHADVVDRLRTTLHAWRESVGAKMPTPNPDYQAQR